MYYVYRKPYIQIYENSQKYGFNIENYSANSFNHDAAYNHDGAYNHETNPDAEIENQQIII